MALMVRAQYLSKILDCRNFERIWHLRRALPDEAKRAILTGESRKLMEIQSPTLETITGVILAGGRARRMGGVDKGLVPFAGRPLIEWVIDGLTPQVGKLLINANRNMDQYASYGHPVINDTIADFQGPLAGFVSAMAAAEPGWIATVPCDGPFLATELVGRLCAAVDREQSEIAVATDGKRMQPVYALIPTALVASLRQFLAEGDRKIDLWYSRHRVALADLSDRPESFININSMQDSKRLEQEVQR